jgi:hypothetical protein
MIVLLNVCNFFHFIFKIRVSLFGHKIQELCFCYLPNIKSTLNKFKWKIHANLNYDKFHGGSDFSHAYVIMHKYFGKNKKCKKWIHEFLYLQLDMFSYIKIS